MRKREKVSVSVSDCRPHSEYTPPLNLFEPAAHMHSIPPRKLRIFLVEDTVDLREEIVF